MALIFAPAFCVAADQNWDELYVAISVVAAVTLLNLLGLRFGVWGQNLFTAAKVLGLILIVLIGVGGAIWKSVESTPENNIAKATTPAPNSGGNSAANEATPAPTTIARVAAFWQAMVFVMFAYGGWSDMAMVSAEVREPKKNLLRALLYGAAAVTLIYLLVNFAYFLRLGFDGILATRTPAQHLDQWNFCAVAGRVMKRAHLRLMPRCNSGADFYRCSSAIRGRARSSIFHMAWGMECTHPIAHSCADCSVWCIGHIAACRLVQRRMECRSDE